MPLNVKVKRLSPTAIIPKATYAGDSGLDLFSDQEAIVNPLSWVRIGTGIALELPLRTEAQIRSRSGLAFENGVIVMNSPGTVDSGYRGELMVLALNLGRQSFNISRGMKIAQLVITKTWPIKLAETDKLAESDRGKEGFGSTGR